MNSNVLIAALVLVVAVIIAYMIMQGPSSSPIEENTVSNGIAATIYKSPSCGCCGQYAAHLTQEGYAVETKAVEDMQVVKEEQGIPYELESCHTMEIGGYIVEGHVPLAAVEKLLAERPDIKGIGMPGMPSGSPGMPGPKNDEFLIYEITHEGAMGELFMTI